jgi:Raf kinase inhibitor-like YbhB/YbcL family protein
MKHVVETTTQPTETFSLASPAFENNGIIPAKYTCDGDKTINPPIKFSGVPEGTKSLVLIMDDPDVPKMLRPDSVFDHWVVFNIPADVKGIPEGGPVIGVAGANGGGTNAYTGPCPPPQYEPAEHHYVFKLYALREPLALSAGATKIEVLDALASVKIAETELIGRYSRK